MTQIADRTYYKGNPRRDIPQSFRKDRDTADFVQELLHWRTHLKRTGEPYLWPSGLEAPDDSITLPSVAVSRTKYAALYSVYGTTFGAGDGSTTFDLPTITAPTINTAMTKVATALKNAYKAVDARDTLISWVSGKRLIRGAASDNVRLEHHHLDRRPRRHRGHQ